MRVLLAGPMSKKTTRYQWLIVAAASDEPHARWLQGVLRKGNRDSDVALWRAELPGTEVGELAARIEQQLEQSQAVLGLLSRHALTTGMPRAIWLTVLKDHLLGVRPMLGLRVESCDVPSLFGGLPYFDLQSRYDDGSGTDQMPSNFEITLLQLVFGIEKSELAHRLGQHRPALIRLPGLSQGDRAGALVHLSRQYVAIHDPLSALECLEIALEIRETLLSASDPLLTATMLTMAEVALEAGLSQDAGTMVARAAQRLEQAPWGGSALAQQYVQAERIAHLAKHLGLSALLHRTQESQEQMLTKMSGKGFDPGLRAARLGRLARDRGDEITALAAFQEALAIWRKRAPEQPEELPRLLNDLGLMLHQQGNLVTARTLLTEAHARWQVVRGEESPEAATSLMNLAVVLQASGELELALQAVQSALDIRTRLRTTTESMLAQTLQRLGSIEESLGLWQEAEHHYREALRVLGDYDDTADESVILRNNLALLLERRGRHDEAGELLEGAWLLVCGRHGASHPACVPVLENRIAHLERTGQLALALERRGELLQLVEATGEASPADLVRLWRQQAVLAGRLGQAEVATAALDAATKKASRLPADHPEVRALRPLQAQYSTDQGDLDTAARLMESHLQEMLAQYEANDPALIAPLEELARVQQRRGALNDAATYLERVLRLREQQAGRQHPNLIPTLLWLGALWQQRGAAQRAGMAAKRVRDLLMLVPDPPGEWLSALEQLEARGASR